MPNCVGAEPGSGHEQGMWDSPLVFLAACSPVCYEESAPQGSRRGQSPCRSVLARHALGSQRRRSDSRSHRGPEYAGLAGKLFQWCNLDTERKARWSTNTTPERFLQSQLWKGFWKQKFVVVKSGLLWAWMGTSLWATVGNQLQHQEGASHFGSLMLQSASWTDFRG